MFVSNPTDKNELAFSEHITKLLSNAKEAISEEDREKLVVLADAITLPVEKEIIGGEINYCLYVCDNNFGCDPNDPPPNCGTCRRICI